MSTPPTDESAPALEEHAAASESTPPAVPLLRRPISPLVLVAVLLVPLLLAGGWYWWKENQMNAREARIYKLVQESRGKLENLTPEDRAWLDRVTEGRAGQMMRQYVPPAPTPKPR